MNPLTLKSLDDLQIITEYSLSNALPERDYFLQQEKGGDLSKLYPLGYGAESVYIASYKGKKLLMQIGKSDLYIITDVPNFGFSLVHYILHTDNKMVRLADSLPIQQLFHYKEEINMSELGNLTKMSLGRQIGKEDNSNTYQAVQGAQQQQQTMQAQTIQGTGIASSTKATEAQVKAMAMGFGYVIGYISPSGPQIRMQLKKTTKKKQNSSIATTDYSLIATETKPAKALRVLGALPKGICMKGDQPASASDIQRGDFDFDEDNTDLAYFCWQEQTAIAYIGAIGSLLPEFAPTHTGSAHPEPKEILTNKADTLGFVHLVARENKNATTTDGDNVKWYLKSTARRTLYTPTNYLPLKQFEHISVNCKTEEDVYNVNDIAFGSLRTVKEKNTETTKLETAYTECPKAIFKRQYKIMKDGVEETVEGIGSAYFMVGETVKVGNTDFVKSDLTYIPWHTTSVKGSSPVAKPVTQIVSKRKELTKNGDTKYKNNTIEFEKSYGDSKYNKYWKQYEKFLGYIRPCIDIDGIKALTTKTKKRNTFDKGKWTTNIADSFNKLLRKEDVVADYNTIVQNFSRDALVAKYSNK